MNARRARLIRIATWVLRIGLPIGVLFVAWNEISRIDAHRTGELLRASDWHYFVASIAAAFVSIMAMGAYDAFAFPSAPALRAVRRWGWATMIFAWSNFLTLGPLGGPAARLYLYRRAGMTVPDVLRGIVRLYIAFFAGLTAWIAAVFAPIGGGGVGGLLVRAGIAALLAPGLALLAARTLYVLRPKLSGPWPARRVVMLGMVGVIDWGAALASFALAARALGQSTDLDYLAKTLYLGQLVGMASMLPGGMGSADAVWLNMLERAGSSAESAAAHVLLFRLSFYLAPWATSTVILVAVFVLARLIAVMRKPGPATPTDETA